MRKCQKQFLMAFLFQLLIGTSALWQHVASAEEVTIASYNIYNLYDIYNDPYSADEGTRVKPHSELVMIAKAIKHINADVVAVQEIENEGILKAFVRDFIPDMGYHTVFVSKTNSTRGGNLGIISRRPVLSVTSHRHLQFKTPDFPAEMYGEMTEKKKADINFPKLSENKYRFARDLLKVRIQATEKTALDLYVVHFKSKRSMSGDPEALHWRYSEAVAARKILAAQYASNPGSLYCMMGDFNDKLDSYPINHLKAAVKHLNKPVLIDAHEHLSKDERVTYPSKKYGFNVIDYMMLSPALSKAVIKDKTYVLRKEELTLGSDHRPVVTRFNLD